MIRVCGWLLVASLAGWLIFMSKREALEDYLRSVRLDDVHARAVAGFSISQPGWFVLFLALAVAFMTLAMRGMFSGSQSRWVGGALLAGMLVVDLGRANLPWIIYWKYPEKYTSNPVIDHLREQPYEQRVAILPVTQMRNSILDQLYRIEWLQNQLPYFNIQSLDIVQMARKPKDLDAFEKKFLKPPNPSDYDHLLPRCWQVTNTRYLFGTTEFQNYLKTSTNELWHQFHEVHRFEVDTNPGILQSIVPKDWTTKIDPNGPWALFEFDGTLPRARLYSNWQVVTNADATLDMLADVGFDPEQSVLVEGGVPTERATIGAVRDAGTVEISKYASKDVVLQANARTSAVLLLNDRFDPNWKSFVDGQPAPLLHCNYLMRGVHLDPGIHTVEFRFQPPIRSLYVSLVSIGVGLIALGFVAVGKNGPVKAPAPVAPSNGVTPAAAVKPRTNPSPRPPSRKAAARANAK